MLFTFLSISAIAQSEMIKTVFRLLPADLVYDLTDATRDSLLDGKTYYPSENDSSSVVAFNYGESTFVHDYMYISMSYETSQRGTGMTEIRGFKMKEKDLIIVSRTGGVEGVNYQQLDISAFAYDRDGCLLPYKDNLSLNWSVDLFLKPGVPEAIKSIILSNANLTYDFSNTNVILTLRSPFLLNNELYRTWLKGDCIKYAWTGKKFKTEAVFFSG